MFSPKDSSKDRKAMMMGLGLDNKDGHKRITKGENFLMLGGSEETHEKMTEVAIKVNESLSSKGKALEELSHEEFVDLVARYSGR